MHKEQTLTDKCYVQRSPKVAARMIGGEMMIMSGRDSSLFSLNETASLLWTAADGQTELEEIAALMCERFEVDLATARRDLLQVARDLADHEIVQLSASPVPQAGS
jgi:hypothetical protein